MNSNKFINSIGLVILLWFLFSIVTYLFSGQFLNELTSLPNLFETQGALVGTYYTLRITSTIAIPLIIPLIIRGKLSALFVILPYLAVGFQINPFHFFLPKGFATYHDGVYFYPTFYGKLWGILSLALVIFFTFYRRNEVKGMPFNKQMKRTDFQPGAGSDQAK